MTNYLPMLGSYGKKLNGVKKEDKLPPRTAIDKLITSLDDKNNYVVHYRNLQLYLELGMKMKKFTGY